MEVVTHLCTYNKNDSYQDLIALPFYKMFEGYFVQYFHGSTSKSKKREDFGGRLLLQVASIRGNRQIAVSGQAVTLLKCLLSLNVKLDVRNDKGQTPLDLCKEGQWEMFELLNLSQMGDSLKGLLYAFLFLQLAHGNDVL